MHRYQGLRAASAGLVLLGAMAAQAQQPDLQISNYMFEGGAKEGHCNALRVSVYNDSMTPTTSTFQVAYAHFYPESGVVVLKSGSVQGGIGGKMTKSLTLYDVPYHGGAAFLIIADNTQVVAESNESNNGSPLFTVGSLPLTGFCSQLSVSDVREPVNAAGGLRFAIKLAPANTHAVVTVSYALADGTAKGGTSCGTGIDFIAQRGVLSFAKNETQKQVEVTLCNNKPTANKSLSLVLSHAKHAGIARGTGHATIAGAAQPNKPGLP